MSTIVIACGGTGGHLAPGIALAEALMEGGHRCLLLVSQKAVDSALTKKYQDLNFVAIPGQGIAGGWMQRLRACMHLFHGMVSALRLLRREAPEAVFLFGGFLSAGPALAARILGIPIAMHEANCAPGRVTRLFAPYAKRVYLPAGLKLPGVAPQCLRELGYPVRREIAALPKASARATLGLESGGKLLLVIGGSQGARALNEWAEKNFEGLAEAGISIYCVSGLKQADALHRQHPSRDGRSGHFIRVEFSDRMGVLLSAADLVVSRAGAGSLAELAACGRPSILIPYPHAVDDHQTANAAAHVQAGAGRMLLQTELGSLREQVQDLIFDEAELGRMEVALKGLDPTNAAAMIAEDLLTLTTGGQTIERGGSDGA